MSTPFTNQRKVEENFNSIFNNKGIVGSVAEKAMNNYQQKKQSRKDAASNQQLYYFGLGFAFKNIDLKEIFNFDSDGKPTRFKYLFKDNFNFRVEPNLFFGNTKNEREQDIKNDFLFYLIDAVRNINCHFIHKFDVIGFSENDNPIKKSIIPFLNESFTLAMVLAYQKREAQKNESKKSEILPTIEFLLNNLDSIILPFAKEVFYQSLYTKTKVNGKFVERTLNDQQKEIKNYIDLHFNKLNNFIDFLLFNEVDEEIEWKLNPNEQNSHKILHIEKGRYLSSNGCLFLLSLFLYKNEANKLIPKISGFKKNGTAEDQAKINVFTTFSKKFSSQDIHHEDQNLVNFRDIIQYLNKYLVSWKPYLEFDDNENKIKDKNLIERDYPNEMVNPLKEKIEIQEIQKYFPYVFSYYDILSKRDADNKLEYQKQKTAFLQYAINKLFRKSNVQKNNLFDYFIEKNIEFQHIYFRVLLNKLEPNNKEYQINKDTFGGNTGKFKNQILNLITNNFIRTSAFNNWNRRNTTNKYFFKDFDVNKKTDKLKKRIEEKSIYTSNCRNQDRFLIFAIRYLAETNYFGEDAQFKMYEFYDTLEQNSYIDSLKGDKKIIDKLKYDGGKIVCFKTYKEHLEKYVDWEMPFLVENNAVYIKISGQDRPIALQKNIIVYFLEDALKGNTDGAKFLNDFIAFKQYKYKEFKEFLQNNEKIENDEKTELLKVFPKRLLHLYNKAKQNNLPEFFAFELILKKVEFMGERYKKLKKQAEANGTLEYFEKKNKGKQFKLQFIRKACNIMYFREAYFITTKEKGHHKTSNISKQEINDFSKWMFLFNGNDIYKQKLKILFESKNFFDNIEFQELFNASNNLDDFFEKTKKLFEKFSIRTKINNNTQKEVLENYIKNHLEIGNIYLNHTLFKEYITNNDTNIKVENNRIKYHYVTENKKYLLEEYYYKTKIEHDEPKAHKHLFTKLNSNRLEDCLLYEIAFKYLNKENNQLKARVDEVLSRDILFLISKQNVNNTSYNLIIPFNKVDRFFELKAKGNENHNILSNLKEYLENIVDKTRYDDKFNKMFDKEIINLSHDFKISNILKLEDINKVNNHIINSSVRFTKCVMVLEEYFIWKHKILITNKNRIDLTEINELYDSNDHGNYFNKNIKGHL